MLRKALILNNLADVYEQFEYWDQAASVYEQAWKSIEEIQDDQIFDLDGYRLEILMSMPQTPECWGNRCATPYPASLTS